MNNNKKIIIITLIVATILACAFGFTVYKITLNNNGKLNKQNYLAVEKYRLQYGTYKGYNIEYELDSQSKKIVESNKTEFILKLNPDNTCELEGKKYKLSIDGLYIKVPDFNKYIIFKVIGDNKIEYQVGEGIEMTYNNK